MWFHLRVKCEVESADTVMVSNVCKYCRMHLSRNLAIQCTDTQRTRLKHFMKIHHQTHNIKTTSCRLGMCMISHKYFGDFLEDSLVNSLAIVQIILTGICPFCDHLLITVLLKCYTLRMCRYLKLKKKAKKKRICR